MHSDSKKLLRELTVNRRKFLTTTCSFMLTSTLPRGLLADEKISLKRIASKKNIGFGTAVGKEIYRNARYSNLVDLHCASLTPENSFKWHQLMPYRNNYSFDESDRLYDYCLQNGFELRGHALIFEKSMRRWLQQCGCSLETDIQRFISTITARYPRIVSWDLFNEIVDHRGYNGWLRKDTLFEKLGASYLTDIARYTHEINPNYELVINEWVGPYSDRYFRSRRNAMLKMLEAFKNMDLPINVFGIQSHLNFAKKDYDRQVKIKSIIDRAKFDNYENIYESAKAQDMLNRMKREFPDSKYTKLAIDPSYANSMKQNEESISAYYENTYHLFEKGNYKEVVSRVRGRATKFPGNKEYAAKFSLINAMSYGNIEGKDKYVKELQNLIRVHPKTPEEARAKEILRFLKGDEEAFNEILYEEAVDVFEADDKKLHYVFIVTYGMSQKEFDRAKLNISAYNKKYHRFDNLKISNIYLNPETKAQVILVRSFLNKDKSLEYFRGVDKNKAEFIQNAEKGYDVFTATQRNYREVIKQRSVNNYRTWFESKYLKK
mgnify:CR=1 FL=1